MDTTDPAPAPVASKEPEKGKNYFGLYLLLVGDLEPYPIWNPISQAASSGDLAQGFRSPTPVASKEP